jgi:hypothetical protein
MITKMKKNKNLKETTLFFWKLLSFQQHLGPS